jgi:hypothetical protein
LTRGRGTLEDHVMRYFMPLLLPVPSSLKNTISKLLDLGFCGFTSIWMSGNAFLSSSQS